MAPDPQLYFLKQVIRVVRAPHHGENPPSYRGFVPIHQGCKGFDVSRERQLD